MGKATYLDFAENDYLFLKRDFEEGRVGNVLCSMAQNICERYLKHIIDIYCSDIDVTDVLRTHSLYILERFIREHLEDFECDWNTVCVSNGYYFSASYPGDNSFLVTKYDVDRCYESVKEARRAVLEYVSCHEIAADDCEDILEDDSLTELLNAFDD